MLSGSRTNNMPEQLITDPEHIAVSKSKGIQIDWKDGHHSSYSIEYLRDWCPCATCTGAHGTTPRAKTTEGAAASSSGNPFPMFKPRERIVTIEAVGSYALRIQWADGHNAGIYSYEHFRNICPCDECKASRV